MTERMIGLDNAVALAEAAVVPEIAVKPKTEKTVQFCVSDGKTWHPVEVPAGAGVGYLKRVTGAMSVQELQYDKAGNVYKEAETLKDHHVYEIFPVTKLDSFVAEHGLHR